MWNPSQHFKLESNSIRSLEKIHSQSFTRIQICQTQNPFIALSLYFWNQIWTLVVKNYANVQ